MEPPGAEAHYTEELVRLPGSGLFYYPRTLQRPTRTKADFGLDDGPLLLMPNNPLKMVPRWDLLFAEITEVTGRPIVFLGGYQPVAAELLKKRFERAGIRARWLPRLSAEDYMKLLALADLVLDPPAWSGGNTTLEALQYRKPVLTMPGEFMRGRHGLAFLTQAGMPSLIAKTPQEYVKIASDPGIWESAVAGANWDGPFEDPRVVPALDEWIRSVARA
jgi:predicted O-linked N-acetylglucosamine transferase (SPINDLY family)